MSTEVVVPALGESITEGTLAQWLKKPGEQVAADEAIATLETDKVSVDVPSPTAGLLTETLVNEGDTVAVGALIRTLQLVLLRLQLPRLPRPMLRLRSRLPTPPPTPPEPARTRNCAVRSMLRSRPGLRPRPTMMR
jgi:2-oxoglutarate dehydrogenase E2 component (dihydrolipoamide succinyltransferase)